MLAPCDPQNCSLKLPMAVKWRRVARSLMSDRMNSISTTACKCLVFVLELLAQPRRLHWKRKLTLASPFGRSTSLRNSALRSGDNIYLRWLHLIQYPLFLPNPPIHFSLNIRSTVVLDLCDCKKAATPYFRLHTIAYDDFRKENSDSTAIRPPISKVRLQQIASAHFTRVFSRYVEHSEKH